MSIPGTLKPKPKKLPASIVVVEDDDPLGESIDVTADRAAGAGVLGVRAIVRFLRANGHHRRNQAMEEAARRAQCRARRAKPPASERLPPWSRTCHPEVMTALRLIDQANALLAARRDNLVGTAKAWAGLFEAVDTIDVMCGWAENGDAGDTGKPAT